MLVANAVQSLGPGPVTVSGGTLTANFAQSISSVTLNSGVLVANAVQGLGPGPLTISGGVLNVNYAQSVSSVTLNGGVLNVTDPLGLGSGPLTIAGGVLDNTSSAVITLGTNNRQYWDGSFTFNGTQNLNLGTGAVVLQVPCAVTVNGGTLTVGGAISGALPWA